MGTVIKLDSLRKSREDMLPQAILAECFANQRRRKDNVFWLKENAEFLNIHQSHDMGFPARGLEPYQSFYDTVERRLAFFPQYYRFFLSITLDLEDLGQRGNKGEALCDWVRKKGLPEAELSDLQRAEALRLLARRGCDVPRSDAALLQRLHTFCERTETFTLPNKKAAYELTHIVFYLSEYGRCDPELSPSAILSLMYAGTLAFMDENADLLAEVSVALLYARQPVPPVWQAWLQQHTKGFHIAPSRGHPEPDAYHEYLMCNWCLMSLGDAGFSKLPAAQSLRFERSEGRLGVIGALSEYLYQSGVRAKQSWRSQRGAIQAALGNTAFQHIRKAKQALPEFDDFFSGFARS